MSEAEQAARDWQPDTRNEDPGLLAFARRCFVAGYEAAQEQEKEKCEVCGELVRCWTYSDGKLRCNPCYRKHCWNRRAGES